VKFSLSAYNQGTRRKKFNTTKLMPGSNSPVLMAQAGRPHQNDSGRVSPPEWRRPGGLDCLPADGENFQHFLFKAITGLRLGTKYLILKIYSCFYKSI
jgi:hypothetical protein